MNELINGNNPTPQHWGIQNPTLVVITQINSGQVFFQDLVNPQQVFQPISVDLANQVFRDAMRMFNLQQQIAQVQRALDAFPPQQLQANNTLWFYNTPKRGTQNIRIYSSDKNQCRARRELFNQNPSK